MTYSQSSPRGWHERVPGDPRVAGLLECLDGHLEAGILPDDLLRVLLRQEGVHQDQRHVCVVSEIFLYDLNASIYCLQFV